MRRVKSLKELAAVCHYGPLLFQKKRSSPQPIKVVVIDFSALVGEAYERASDLTEPGQHHFYYDATIYDQLKSALPEQVHLCVVDFPSQKKIASLLRKKYYPFLNIIKSLILPLIPLLMLSIRSAVFMLFLMNTYIL